MFKSIAALKSLIIAFCFGVATANAQPKTIVGRVIVDDNRNGRADDSEPGLADVAVTDGVQVVLTGEDGRFTLALEPDEVIPFVPARTIAVSWPSEHWPVGRWYHRLSGLRKDQELLFLLQPQKQELPFGIVHGTDPHDCFRRDFNRLWSNDVRRMGDLIDFAVITGDLGYINMENADKELGQVRRFSDDFPVPVFHVPGNHDLAGVHSPEWKKSHDLAGNGGFTKHLGPVRWSFSYTGVHIVGIDWARPVGNTLETGVPDVAIEWLERDLARLPKGTRTILFAHQFWTPNPKFFETAERHGVELMLGGHSHRNIDLSSGSIKMLTTMSLSKLLHVYEDRHELVDFCPGYRPSNPGYHGKYCHLDEISAIADRRGKLQETGAARVNSGELKLTHKAIGPGLQMTASLKLDMTKQAIIRLSPQGRKADAVDIVLQGHTIHCRGLTTTAGRRPTDSDVSIELLVDHGGLEAKINGRVYFSNREIRPTGRWIVSLVAPTGGIQLSEAKMWPIAKGTPENLMKVAEHYKMTYQGERAEPYWRAILAQNPGHAAANQSLGRWLLERGRGEEAEGLLKRAGDDKDEHRRNSLLLADWYATAGREKDAAGIYLELLKKEEDLGLKNKLAWLYLTATDHNIHNTSVAVRLATELCKATEYKEARYLDTLCVALGENGDFAAALEAAKKGFAQATQTKDRLLIENMRMRIATYEELQRDPSNP